MLAELRASLLVTTYQASKLVVLRNDNGVLNTHFRNFAKPMGLAISGGKLAVGASVDIHEFHNVPASCELLNSSDSAESSRKADARFLPRRVHTTGDVQIHELVWIDKELWFVNTAFSCLSTRSETHSFDVRWRPKFVKQLPPVDCCHLNGLAVRNGRPRYVTARGETDVPAGWRDNKRDGGVLIDVDSDDVIVRGLSIPHSPRWHRNQLWLLESGDGSLGRVDLRTGSYEPIARMPGFTRGLAFYGPLAFVGLSQVRESAIFSGFPLVERDEERFCGVWVVNIETGETVAFVRFDGDVQESSRSKAFTARLTLMLVTTTRPSLAAPTCFPTTLWRWSPPNCDRRTNANRATVCDYAEALSLGPMRLCVSPSRFKNFVVKTATHSARFKSTPSFPASSIRHLAFVICES